MIQINYQMHSIFLAQTRSEIKASTFPLMMLMLRLSMWGISKSVKIENGGDRFVPPHNIEDDFQLHPNVRNLEAQRRPS